MIRAFQGVRDLSLFERIRISAPLNPSHERHRKWSDERGWGTFGETPPACRFAHPPPQHVMSYQNALSRLIAAAPLLLAAACNSKIDQTKALDPAGVTVTPFENPAPVGSSSPGLTVTPNGRLYLSWQERLPDSSLVLKYASRNPDDTAWTAVSGVNTGKNMLASATDVPTVHEQPNGSLVAIWRGNHGEAGYDVVMAHSTDSGKTWSPPRSPHGDVTPTEHGFVSWLQLGDTADIVWLDGRLNADADKAKHVTRLAVASLDASGASRPESVIDSMVCDCCHTASALVPGGAAIAYRNRDVGDIRDINVIRLTGTTWQTPVRVHADNWQISGCPVNGPAISARGADVVVAWFTAANDTARVRLAFSSDTAITFAAPFEINEGFPDGKVGVVLANDGDAIVSWIERRGTMAVLRARSVKKDGTRSVATDVADLGEGKRAGGAPKLLLQGDVVVLAWSDLATNRVRTATVKLPE